MPTCGLTALLASSALQQWYFPGLSVPLMASCIVLFFTFINLCGVKWVMRLAMPIATVSALLAFLSAVVPVFSGSVDWQQAFTFRLTVPFEGWFGQVTSVMAGLYIIGFAAPAFEQAACHVGETINPNRNVPRAMFTSAALASLYFIVLPIVWLGALGPEAHERLFTYGFTTKKTGHGFGLHASALAAQDMGGTLRFSRGGTERGGNMPRMPSRSSPPPGASPAA